MSEQCAAAGGSQQVLSAMSPVIVKSGMIRDDPPPTLKRRECLYWNEGHQRTWRMGMMPKTDPIGQPDEPQDLADHAARALTRMSAKILVVEDEMIVALDLQHTLQQMGYTVVGIVSSGCEAICRSVHTQPDLVLMDIHLSGDLDGIDAATQIRTQTGAAVIFLTAQADEATLRRARKTKPSDLLFKPYAEHTLQEAIETALCVTDD